GASQALHETHGSTCRLLPAGDFFRQGAPLEEFPDQVHMAVVFQAIQDRHDVRVLEPSENGRFLEEAPGRRLGTGFGAEGANGYDPVQAALAGAIDDGQAALPGDIEDFVTG